ncbi:hypothetical protein MNBD_GAMMA08-2138 [hydrothermal vent metagenome]|uniref:Yip1 domain-containing protein n=1 Tax=hydrothermal vent metagenome TaxID=652676 RepID=A0A3B0XCS6_9ZZZZ
MNSFLNILWGNLLLKKGPQDFPCSFVLMRLCLMVYFVTGLPRLLISVDFFQAVLIMALDIIVLLGFVYFCLRAFSKSERFTQSMTGFASVGVVFQLMVLPLLYVLNSDPEVAKTTPILPVLFLLFFSWNLTVYAHLFRESFGLRLPVAMILTICYIVISWFISTVFFPELA